jgi:transporter family protein
MAPWAYPAIGATVFIALHYMLLRAASGRLGDTLGALVLESTAALGIVVAFIGGVRSAPVPTTRLGVFFAVASGLAISGASILLFMALRKGGPVASTGALVMGGGVTVSALFAPWFFQESFTIRRVVGVLLGVAAMVVLAQDPGRDP